MIAIDPGKRHLAWAEFIDNRLADCGLAEGTPRELRLALEEIGLRRELTVIECPQIYPSRRWRGDPNDLIDVAVTAGVAAGVLCRRGKVEYVRPGTWKGAVKKPIMLVRIINVLGSDERMLLEACGVTRGNRHNVIDAIGLGLWRLGREPK
jgi:hypothetical protein